MSSKTIKTRATIKLNQMCAVIGKLEDGKHNLMFSKVLAACQLTVIRSNIVMADIDCHPKARANNFKQVMSKFAIKA